MMNSCRDVCMSICRETACVRVWMSACMCCVRAWVWACMCAGMCVCGCLHACACVRGCLYVGACVEACVHACSCVRMQGRSPGDKYLGFFLEYCNARFSQ